MAKKKTILVKQKALVMEPVSINETPANKRILFFDSFEESKEHSRKEMAATSYEQRLINLQIIRERSRDLKPAAKNKKASTPKILIIKKAHYL